MLTQRDLNQLEKLVDERLDEKLDAKLRGLPTRDEFYKAVDKIMGELQAIREEHTISGYQVRDNEERIEALERKVKLLAN